MSGDPADEFIDLIGYPVTRFNSACACLPAMLHAAAHGCQCGPALLDESVDGLEICFCFGHVRGLLCSGLRTGLQSRPELTLGLHARTGLETRLTK